MTFWLIRRWQIELILPLINAEIFTNFAMGVIRHTPNILIFQLRLPKVNDWRLCHLFMDHNVQTWVARTLQGTQTSAPKYIPAALSAHTLHADLWPSLDAASVPPARDVTDDTLLTSAVSTSHSPTIIWLTLTAVTSSVTSLSHASRDDVTAADVAVLSSIMSHQLTTNTNTHRLTNVSLLMWKMTQGTLPQA